MFHPKSNWKPLLGHPGLKLFLSQRFKEIFNGLPNDLVSVPSNISKEDWEELREQMIQALLWRKRSCEVVWCRDDCIKEEANKQMEDKTVYKDIKFKETILSDLMDKSNRILKSFYKCKFITEKEVKYFSYDFKKTSNVDKFYLLPKIHE